MFTGMVQELGTVIGVARRRGVDRMTIQAAKSAAGLCVGESLAVNGVCLSAVQVRGASVEVEMIPETRRRTSLGSLRSGDRVNLERSLTLSDRLNGHVVLGHVDGVGRVLRAPRAGGDIRLEIGIDRRLGRYLVPKGPVAIDGVSLTVGLTVSPTRFSVFLIPETLRKTTFAEYRAGRRVNIEVDYFAKLLAQWADGRHHDNE